MYAPTMTNQFEAKVERITGEKSYLASEANDAWTEAIEEVYAENNITVPLHVLENGFEQGDATDEEMQGINLEALTASLEAKYESKLDALIEKMEAEYA